MKKEIQISFWKALFDYIAAKAPVLLAAFGIGYKVGHEKVQELETENLKLGLALEKERNANTVRENENSKSDADLVRDSINDGRSGR